MPDITDQGIEIEERLLEALIEGQRSQGRELNPIGECHDCFEPFEPGDQRLFCDRYCSESYEKRKTRQ